MKKLVILAVAAVCGLAANAQLVQSTTFYETKKESHTMWYSRVGLSLNNAAGEATGEFKDANGDGSSLGAKVGYDIAVGFHKPVGGSGLYWGMEYGLGTRGAKASAEGRRSETKWKLLAHNVKLSPFTFGYKYSLTDELQLDAHLGAFASFDYAGKGSVDWGNGDEEEETIADLDYNPFDAGLQVGIGVWFSRFNLDFTYQRGFLNASDDYDLDGNNVYSSNLMIRLGVAF